MIPKIIHYVWLGGREKSQLVRSCMESWKRYAIGYEIVEWNESKINEIDSQFMRDAIAHKKWAHASDVIRLYALKKYGGIYLDTDLELLDNIDEFLKYDFVTCYEKWNFKYSLITTAFIGAAVGNSIVSDCLEMYAKLPFIRSDGSLNLETNVKRITDYLSAKFGIAPPYRGTKLLRLMNDDGAVIFPYYYFCKKRIFHKSYAVHHAIGSWLQCELGTRTYKCGKVGIKIFKRRGWCPPKFKPLRENRKYWGRDDIPLFIIPIGKHFLISAFVCR